MKELLSIFCCALIFVLLFSGCMKNNKNADVDLESLREQLICASALPEMLSVNSSSADAENNLTSISDIEYDKVDEYFIDYSSTGSAYEIAVIKLKSEDDVQQLESDLQEHVENRVKQYKYYMPDQVENAENAVVATSGKYVCLIMCDDTFALKSVFEKAFE